MAKSVAIAKAVCEAGANELALLMSKRQTMPMSPSPTSCETDSQGGVQAERVRGLRAALSVGSCGGTAEWQAKLRRAQAERRRSQAERSKCCRKQGSRQEVDAASVAGDANVSSRRTGEWRAKLQERRRQVQHRKPPP